MLPALVETLGEAVLLAEVPPRNELRFQPGGASPGQGGIPQRVPQGLGEASQLQTTNGVRVPPPLQSRGMTHIGQIASEADPVKAAQLSGERGSRR